MMENLEPKRISLELSVGEVAKRSGVAVPPWHFYEAEGIDGAAGATRGNQRRDAAKCFGAWP